MAVRKNGITLIALVITIIIMLILAGVTISIVVNGGLFKQAQSGTNQTMEAMADEQAQTIVATAKIASYSNSDFAGSLKNAVNGTDFIYDGASTITDTKTKSRYVITSSYAIKNPGKEIIGDSAYYRGVNSPKLMPGMTVVYWDGTTEKVPTTENEWYDYANQKWANAKTADGSYWVWIPRYEYQITSGEGTNTTGTIDVKFIPTSQTIADSGYKIEPCFQNGTSDNFQNGEWDKELDGFWVAKFAAGYAGGGKDDSNNNVAPVDTGIAYSGSFNNAANYYGPIISGSTTMKYPVFLPKTYACNYINVASIYNLSRNLTKTGNPYGLDTSTDSHMIKNSEWGAVAYLSQSQYGRNGTEIYINNLDINAQVPTIDAVTGYAGDSASESTNTLISLPAELGDAVTGPTYTSYAWNTANGEKASSNGNISGIYDLNGCIWEYTSSYITNGNSYLSLYGWNEISTKADSNPTTVSTKYATAYPCVLDVVSEASNRTNFKDNYYGIRYGDAIAETASLDTNASGWFDDSTNFPWRYGTIFVRGGNWSAGASAGVFSFINGDGSDYYHVGFRVVLCAK